jgi:hypothetical protein
MRVFELSGYLQSTFDYPFYNNQLPAIQNPNVGIVRMFPVQTSTRPVNRVNAQCLVKNSDMQTAESLSWEIYELLRMKTDFSVGNTKVILCRATQPEFVQETDDGCFLYSVDLSFITDQGE